jgi:uncharacterized protein (TIGR02246 family)
MKRYLAVFCSTALVALLTGCSEPAANTDADVKAVKDNEVQWNKDYEAKDAAKVVAHFTDDAVLMVGGGPASIGKAAIQKALTEMVADPALSLKFQADRVEVSKSGDMAYTQGSYTLTLTDPATKRPINDKGSYLTVYKKQADGSWKAVRDAAISEVPPPAPAPEPAKKKK